MLKGYRRRFVIYNMLLVSIVLLITFVALDVFLIDNHYADLKISMSRMIEPWNKINENFVPEQDTTPPPLPKTNAESDNSDGQIVVVFYDMKNSEVNIVSDNTTIDSSVINEAVKTIVNGNENFGTLKEYEIIYYKELQPGPNDNLKVSLVKSSYMLDWSLKTTAILFVAFVGSLCVFFFISLWLSKLAAKPMEKAVSMVSQFVADISHDLKTPITIVLANNSILKSNQNSTIKEQAQWIESTDTAAKNMMNMVNEMLTLSSLESVEKSIKKEPVCISALLEKSVLQLESVAYDRNISLETAIGQDLFVLANDDYISRICNGLLENALKYEPDGGKVEISLYKSKKKVVLTVKNFGSVISKEDLPHIFERFYRGDKARSIQSGHGLGLPIIKQIIKLVCAEISVNSSENIGTEFTVEFNSFEE